MKRARQFAILCALVLAAAGVARSATPDDCHVLRKHGHRAEAQACYESLTRTRDPYLRAEGDWGLAMYTEANNEFRAAVAQSDSNAVYRVRWGRLLHERFNNTDAEGLFKEALQRDPKNAQAYLGLALVSADGFDNKAIEWAAKALELDPKLVDAHELLAETHARRFRYSPGHRAGGRGDQALSRRARRHGHPRRRRSPRRSLARRMAREDRAGQSHVRRRPTRSSLTISSCNNRYEDGVAYYRKAIELDPQLWSARSELGINLMRLGQEDEPRHQLEMCYDNGYRNEATVNSLRLLDSYKNFVVFKDATTILKLNKKEADLLHPYFEEILKRAIATYEKKYKMTLPGPVQVEVYPDHEDFAVRTMGMPGLGALGVTFGEVVAMDSPSARPPGDFNWASTLWHEMSHVYILTATNHRVAALVHRRPRRPRRDAGIARVGRSHHAGYRRSAARQKAAAGRGP